MLFLAKFAYIIHLSPQITILSKTGCFVLSKWFSQVITPPPPRLFSQEALVWNIYTPIQMPEMVLLEKKSTQFPMFSKMLLHNGFKNICRPEMSLLEWDLSVSRSELCLKQSSPKFSNFNTSVVLTGILWECRVIRYFINNMKGSYDI